MMIHFVNVGYGDAILIEFPMSKDSDPFTILIDTGNANKEDYPTEGPRIMVTEYLEKRGISKLDLLILSHPHEDHIAMTVPVLEHLEVKELWVNHLIPERAWDKKLDSRTVREASFLMDSLNIYTLILADCYKRGIPVKAMGEKGKCYSLNNDLSIKVLNNQTKQTESFGERLSNLFDKNGNVPIYEKSVQEELILLNKECNASSLALLLEWKGKRALLTGDSCPEYWPALMLDELDNLEIDLFKLPHHGQRDSINAESIRAICPRYIVTSSASDRKNDCPHPDCYRLIEENMADKPVMLFTDEVLYEPYFKASAPFRALIITLVPGRPGYVELDYCPGTNFENSRAEVLV